jgi:hypothetical protein
MTKLKSAFRKLSRAFTTQDASSFDAALDQIEEGMEQEPDELEVHNHMPEDYGVNGKRWPVSEPEWPPHADRRRVDRRRVDRRHDDEEGEEGAGQVVARYPGTHHAQFEDDQLVVYDGPPNQRTDRFDMDRGTTDSKRPPQTLSELNALHKQHYATRGPGR